MKALLVMAKNTMKYGINWIWWSKWMITIPAFIYIKERNIKILYHCLFLGLKNQSPHKYCGRTSITPQSNSKVHVPDNMAPIGHMFWERQGEWEESILYFLVF